MTRMSDTDRLMALVNRIHEVACEDVGREFALPAIKNLCEREFLKWREMEENADAVRSAYYGDLGIGGED